jgi:hypothetical protein
LALITGLAASVSAGLGVVAAEINVEKNKAQTAADSKGADLSTLQDETADVREQGRPGCAAVQAAMEPARRRCRRSEFDNFGLYSSALWPWLAVKALVSGDSPGVAPDYVSITLDHPFSAAAAFRYLLRRHIHADGSCT